MNKIKAQRERESDWNFSFPFKPVHQKKARKRKKFKKLNEKQQPNKYV